MLLERRGGAPYGFDDLLGRGRGRAARERRCRAVFQLQLDLLGDSVAGKHSSKMQGKVDARGAAARRHPIAIDDDASLDGNRAVWLQKRQTEPVRRRVVADEQSGGAEQAVRRMLEETEMPIKRIAAQCGFGQEERLRRAFARQVGTTPAEYRARF